MADGMDERSNRAPSRGSRLRYSGDELGNKPEYSDNMDFAIGATTLNSRPDMDENQQGDKSTKAGSDLRGKTGLIHKEPLS
jgi:hypothetical protein